MNPSDKQERADKQREVYEAVADAVNEIADAASDAFRAVDITPGEWDGDNIVQDVKRGIVGCIQMLGRRTEEPSRVTNKRNGPYTRRWAGSYDSWEYTGPDGNVVPWEEIDRLLSASSSDHAAFMAWMEKHRPATLKELRDFHRAADRSGRKE